MLFFEQFMNVHGKVKERSEDGKTTNSQFLTKSHLSMFSVRNWVIKYLLEICLQHEKRGNKKLKPIGQFLEKLILKCFVDNAIGIIFYNQTPKKEVLHTFRRYQVHEKAIKN